MTELERQIITLCRRLDRSTKQQFRDLAQQMGEKNRRQAEKAGAQKEAQEAAV